MVWRMSELEMTKRAIVRALRRDIPNGGHGWGPWIKQLADQIENGEIEIKLPIKKNVA